MLSVQTPAKINLFLNIRPRRPDGYHEVATIMQAIRLWDRLDIMPRLDQVPDIRFSCNVPALEQNPEENLVVKAYRLFWQETGLPPLGLEVHLEKDIPMQAGLGGGSSDAAAMLIVLNHLSHAGLADAQLQAMGARLGSDVPFFILGGIALASGRGEIIQPLPVELVPDLSLVVVKPKGLSIDTALAYHRYAGAARYEVKSPEHTLMAFKMFQQRRRAKDDAELESYLLNDFEKVLLAEYPILDQMARKMRELGLHRPLLSGSGSAMVGFAESNHAMRSAVQQAFPRSQFEIFWTRTLNRGITQLQESQHDTVPDYVLSI